MTYQELLEEFSRRRARNVNVTMDVSIPTAIDNLEWVIQSILEKLRDGDKQ